MAEESASRPVCPSCGRFVGPLESCPHCGARLEGRLSLRAVKSAALLLATVGLIFLWWLARTQEVPVVTVESARGTMNLAYVRFSGRVVGEVTYDAVDDYLAFWVDDGTGEVRVSAYDDATRDLVSRHRVPAPGDEVDVAGTLRVRENYVSLTLEAPEHLLLTRPDPFEVEIASLTPLDEGLRVRVVGTVRRAYVPYPGLTIVVVGDDSGEVAVVLDEALLELSGSVPSFEAGQGIVATGSVTLYRGEPQIAPATVDDLALASVPPRPTVDPVEESSTPMPSPSPTARAPRSLHTLSAADVGEDVLVAGEVVALEGFNGGLRATLDDGTAQVILLLWEDVHRALTDPTSLDVGAEVWVEGEVQEYRGELEVVPWDGDDVEVVLPAPPPPWVEVASLSASDAGRVVRLRGVLGPPEPFSAGVKVPLDDGTGTITVLLWESVVVGIEVAPEVGLILEVVGTVELYRSELEVVPRSPYDWRPGGP